MTGSKKDKAKSMFQKCKMIIKYICFAGLIIFGLMSIIGTGGGSGSSVSGGISGSGK